MINFSKLAALAKATPKELAQSTSADALAQEKLTRRAALRRIGMTGAMTVLGVLSIDELARVAAKKLDEHEMTRGLAKDFKNAGVAMAGPKASSEIICQGDCNQVCVCLYQIEIGNCGSKPQLSDFSGVPIVVAEGALLAALATWDYCILSAEDNLTNCINQLCH